MSRFIAIAEKVVVASQPASYGILPREGSAALTKSVVIMTMGEYNFKKMMMFIIILKKLEG